MNMFLPISPGLSLEWFWTQYMCHNTFDARQRRRRRRRRLGGVQKIINYYRAPRMYVCAEQIKHSWLAGSLADARTYTQIQAEETARIVHTECGHRTTIKWAVLRHQQLKRWPRTALLCSNAS